MKLVQLEILSLPGIEPGFALRDIAPGVNLVTGPNAIGKSSLARALRHLAIIAPGDPKAIALNAVLENGGLWIVRRAGSQLSWQRDGAPVEPPALPDGDAIGCYWLSMENLQAADAGDERLLTQLRRALAGGFDLRALRGGAFGTRQRTGLAEAQRLTAAITALNTTASQYQRLQDEEAELPRLHQAIIEARQAAERARRLGEAVALIAVLRECDEIQAVLAGFADGMDRLQGDELMRLDALEEKRRELTTKLAAARRHRDDTQARLVSTGLAEGKPDPGFLQAQEDLLARIHRQRDRLDDRQQELAQARAEEAGAREALGGGDTAPRLSQETVNRAEKFARELRAKQRACEELAARTREAGPAPSEDEIHRHHHAADALRGWLAAPEQAAGTTKLPWALVVVGAAAAMLFGAVAGAWVAVAGGILALAGAVWIATSRRGDDVGEDARRRFDASSIEPPAHWQRDAVLERLAAVEQALSALRERRARAEAGSEDGRRLERAERELRTMDEERQQLVQELGVDPGLMAAGIEYFLRFSDAWCQALNRCEGLTIELEKLGHDMATCLATVQRNLAQWQVIADDDPESLGAALQGLKERCRNAEQAETRLAELEREIARLEHDLAALDDETAGLYERTGLECGSRDALRLRLDHLKGWRSEQERLADGRRREARARQALEDEKDLLTRAEHGEHDVLLQEQDEARAVADTLDALQERNTAIRTRINDAGIDRRLEQAAAAIDAEREALSDRCDEVLFAEAGQFLLDGIEQEFRSEHEPVVLREARERFRSFTHHAWDVELGEDQGWIARDLQQGAQRNLAELSSGTRMQLLLAVRLAWIRSLEHEHEPFPLFLDEALTTSDEARFASVVRSIQHIAKDEGRQVFYLSARREEVEFWARAAGERPHHIDLAEVRFGRQPSLPEDFALPETVPLPEPAGRSPEAYAAALGVQPVDPLRPEGTLPLFHLLRDDLDLVYQLMAEWRITTLGQLEELLGSSAATTAIPRLEQRQALAFRCAGARGWIASWRLGRGRPVNRIALEISGAVTPAFLDQVAELAASLDGDASSLLDALRAGEVRRFRKDAIDQLEAWFREHGHIDPAQKLDSAGRARRALLTLDGRATPVEIRQLVAWLEAGMKEADEPEVVSAV